MKTFLTRSRLPSKSLPTPAPGRGPGCTFASSHGTPARHRRPSLLSLSSPVNRSPRVPLPAPGPTEGLVLRWVWRRSARGHPECGAPPFSSPLTLLPSSRGAQPRSPRAWQARAGGEPGRRKDGALSSRGELCGEEQERSGCSRSLQWDSGWSSPPGTPLVWPPDPGASPPAEPGARWSPGRVSPEASRAPDPSTHLLSVSSSNTGAPRSTPWAGNCIHIAAHGKSIKTIFFSA